MNYGFVIDNRKCIGCHACTTACKSENDVALGVFRTWVKNVEKGIFPDVRRYFTVLRCNHCDNPPCVHICPTRALYKRKDGIVDFANDYCIACRSCMAACPYDAIYIDPETQTAAKCHYCAHRVEIGLQPACVVVCPEQAIVAGDMDNPSEEISRLVSREQISSRKPEKGTQPKLHYIDADRSSLVPMEATPSSVQYMWAERRSESAPIEFPETSELGSPRETYNVGHETPWGGLVSAYLWTKSIAAGALLISALAVLYDLFGLFTIQTMTNISGPGLGLLFIAFTAVLLVADLGQPRRFLLIFFHPNWRSWLVWGSYILLVFGLACLGWAALAIVPDRQPPRFLVHFSLWVSLATAGYSAFLLAQAKARDLWQSPVLLLTLLLHALAAGAAAHAIVAVLGGFPADDLFPLLKLMSLAMVFGVLLHLLELRLPHGNRELSLVTDLIQKGRFSGRFWMGGVLIGTAVPLCLVYASLWLADSSLIKVLAFVAGTLTLIGIMILEDIWVRAGQALPQS